MSDTTKADEPEKRRSRLEQTIFSVGFWFVVNLLALLTVLAIHFGINTSNAKWWPDAYGLATNVLIGGLVSFLFYYLVVHYPEQRKKNVIKNNLTQMYRAIKQDILWAIIAASKKGGRRDLSADLDTVERLMKPTEFKATFAGGREGHEGFYAFENQMSDDTFEFREIVLNLQMLAKQIEFVLHNYTMDDQRLFDFFKRLEMMLLKLQQSTPGYDESKALCGFIYEVYAGWSWLDGYRDYDIIEKMIADI